MQDDCDHAAYVLNSLLFHVGFNPHVIFALISSCSSLVSKQEETKSSENNCCFSPALQLMLVVLRNRYYSFCIWWGAVRTANIFEGNKISSIIISRQLSWHLSLTVSFSNYFFIKVKIFNMLHVEDPFSFWLAAFFII